MNAYKPSFFASPAMLAALFALVFVLYPHSSDAKPFVSWTPSLLFEAIGVGQSSSRVVLLTASRDATDVTLRIGQEIEPYVAVSPSTLGSITEGSTYTFTVTFSAPSDAPLGIVDGTIQLRSGKKGLAKILPVEVEVVLPQVSGWEEEAPFPSLGHRQMPSFSIGGKGYVGVTNFGATQGEFWEYDPAADQWTRKEDYPASAWVYGSYAGYPHFVVNNIAYVVTNFEVWAYDPLSDVWEQKSFFPGGDPLGGFGLSVEGKGYIGGGFYNQSRVLWEYDPALDQWTPKGVHPTLGWGGSDVDVGCFGFTIGDKAYVTGTNMYFWIYDPVLNEWEYKGLAAGDFGTTTYGIGFAVDGLGYVFNTHGDLYLYDPVMDIWGLNTWYPYPGQPMCYPAGFAIDGSIHVGMGGVFENNTCTLDFTEEVWKYTP